MAQLLADLQKMPGGAGLLKKQAAKQKTKERGSVSDVMSSVINFLKLIGVSTEVLWLTVCSVRCSLEESPGRIQSGCLADRLALWEKLSLCRGLKMKSWSWAWRRSCWRSVLTFPRDRLKNIFLPVVFQTNEFDDDALQVRRAPQRRGTPRPNRSKPHVIRAAEDISEEEIQLVADNMTDKVYNSVTVSPEPVAPVVLTWSCHYRCFSTSSRAPPATSAVRRLLTPRHVAEVKTVEGSRGSSVDRVWGTDTERMSGRRWLIRSDGWSLNTRTRTRWFSVFILEITFLMTDWISISICWTLVALGAKLTLKTLERKPGNIPWVSHVIKHLPCYQNTLTIFETAAHSLTFVDQDIVKIRSLFFFTHSCVSLDCRSGSVLPAVASATAASAANARVAVRRVSFSPWLSTMGSQTSTPTSSGGDWRSTTLIHFPVHP